MNAKNLCGKNAGRGLSSQFLLPWGPFRSKHPDDRSRSSSGEWWLHEALTLEETDPNLGLDPKIQSKASFSREEI
jgi:hypothetical protein